MPDLEKPISPDASIRTVDILKSRSGGGLESLSAGEVVALESAGGATSAGSAERIERLRDGIRRAGRDQALGKLLIDGAREGLSRVENGEPPKTLAHLAGLEAVILTDGTRPSLTVHDGFINREDSKIGMWDMPLVKRESTIRQVIRSVGRINMQMAPGFAGTGFLVAPGVLVTNRHVLELLANGEPAPGSPWTLRDPNSVVVDFVGEAGASTGTRVAVREVLAAPLPRIANSLNFERNTDLAVLRLADDMSDRPPPALSAKPEAVKSGKDIYVVGFPASPNAYYGDGQPPPGWETSEVMDAVFDFDFGFKKLAPGKIARGFGQVDDDPNQKIFTHDASTVGGNSGSCVVDLTIDGPITLGLHFAGVSREQNYAHLIAKLREILEPLGAVYQ